MSGFLKSRVFLMKYMGLVLLLGFISLGSIGGCNNNGGGQDTARALTENDFAEDSALRGDPEGGVIVDFLEYPDSVAPENDTGEVGIDEIPVKYPETVEQTFCWVDDDGEAMHFMELLDSEGSEILKVDVNGECVTEIIEAGNYIMNIYHDGRIETTHSIFIIPNPDDIEEARETDGLINRFKVAAAIILKGIQIAVYKDARAQTVAKNIETLLRTNSCIRCNLVGADLSEAKLRGSNLFDANLFDANLVGADLKDANLRRAFLPEANLFDANLSGADLKDANLSGAFLAAANLQDADLSGADLKDANLQDANLTGANLRNASWCNGCICADPSISTCVGCPPQDTCTGR